jgi:hypothetical protein
MRLTLNFQKREMDNHTFGEVFEREAPRSSRPSISTTQFRTSYNEDLMSPNIGDEGDDGDAHPSMIRPKCIYFPEHFCCYFSSNLCVLNTSNMD